MLFAVWVAGTVRNVRAGDHPSTVQRRLDLLAAQVAAAGRLGGSIAPVEFSDRLLESAVPSVDTESTLGPLVRLDLSLPPFQAQSRIGVISAWHRLIGKSIRRDSVMLEAQMQAVRREVTLAVQALVNATNDRLEATFELLSQQVKAADDKLAGLQTIDVERLASSVDRLSDSFDARLAATEARLDEICAVQDQLRGWVSDQQFDPTFSNLDFADRFRGSRDDILLRYHDVAEILLRGGGDVLDLGCGRGELVELVVAKEGVARGVEVDPELVDFCRSIFLDVSLKTATEALDVEPDSSLGGVALIQVVEHLTAQQLLEVVPLAHQKLRAGGVLAIETVNGTSPFVYTRSFFCDPTHSTPVHHEYLEFVLQQAGFTDIEIQWRSPVDDKDKVHPLDVDSADSAVNALAIEVNERINQIDMFLFGAQDYLVIATK